MHKINKEVLKTYLVECVGIGMVNQELQIKQFSEGQSNPTFYLKFGPKEFVLRKKPPGNLLRGAHQIDREFKVMNAVHERGFPVPQMIHFCSNKDVIGTEFFLMEYIPGRVLGPLMHSVPPSGRMECMINAASTLAQLHQLNPDEIGLKNYGKKFGFCKRVLSTWTKQYYNSAHKDIPEMHQLIDWLEKKLPSIPDESTIVHGDCSLYNIMFHSKNNTVAAVLDWELSTIGHPLVDFSYLCLPYHGPLEYFMQSLQYNVNIEQLIEELPSETEVMKHYCRLRGISYPIPNWNFYLALNLFKMAAIVQGVYARSLQGNASSPTAAMFGEMVEPLVLAALKLTKRLD